MAVARFKLNLLAVAESKSEINLQEVAKTDHNLVRGYFRAVSNGMCEEAVCRHPLLSCLNLSVTGHQ